MMAEYIKREDAIKIAEKYGLANGSVLGRHTGLADCIASEISAIPTADVAPVVRGRWLTWDEKFPGRATGKNLGVFCSVCGNNSDYSSPYCPNCGAKMEEEDENGREEIARSCEFCDGKHAAPYEKNGQMLTPYQETFRTKLFIGDLPWAGKTLFVRSYYCPTYGDSYCNGPRMDSFQINFCPHCGRDLRGDRKDGRN